MSADFDKVYAGKRVLVTGHTGFKGSWLTLWLTEMGAEVTGYALEPEYTDSHFEGLGLTRKISHIVGDIRDADSLMRAVNDCRPEVVFHLAAQALVRRSYDDPKTTFDTNVGGSVNLLETVRASDCIRALVFITSDKAYLNKEWPWGYRETDELGGHDPYSASKAASEMVFMAYWNSFLEARPEIGLATARAGNVIGGGDWAADRMLPDCMRALRDSRPIFVRNPQATRPWQHVLDPLNGYLQLAAALLEQPTKLSGSWNFGPEITRGLSVQQVTERVLKRWGSGEAIEQTEANAPFEHTLLQLNIDKAKLVLGWRPIWCSERAIDETVDWYLRVDGGADPAKTSLEQIASFVGSQ